MTATETRQCYRFVNHRNVPENPPETTITKVLDKAFTDDPLTNDEKILVCKTLYGLFGTNSSVYKIAGWAWPMYHAKQMRAILVSFEHDESTYRAYSAPDKLSLLSALNQTRPVFQMIYAPTALDEEDKVIYDQWVNKTPDNDD